LVVGIQMDESEDSEQVPNKPICIVNKVSVYNTHYRKHVHSIRSIRLIYLKTLSVDQVCVAANERMTVNNELERKQA
jgi:hypothetical protein